MMQTSPLKSTKVLASKSFGSTIVELMLVKILNSFAQPHVVAVARGAVGHDAPAVDIGAHLPRLERLDHAVLLRHAADPVVGLH